MKKTLAITTAMLLLGSMVVAQTAGDKNKTATSKTKSAKTSATSSTKPQAVPFPTRRPADKAALNPQPLPPGAKTASASPESKVALNPQPLPPGAKAMSQKKGATEKSRKKSTSTNSGSTTPK